MARHHVPQRRSFAEIARNNYLFAMLGLILFAAAVAVIIVLAVPSNPDDRQDYTPSVPDPSGAPGSDPAPDSGAPLITGTLSSSSPTFFQDVARIDPTIRTMRITMKYQGNVNVEPSENRPFVGLHKGFDGTRPSGFVASRAYDAEAGTVLSYLPAGSNGSATAIAPGPTPYDGVEKTYVNDYTMTTAGVAMSIDGGPGSVSIQSMRGNDWMRQVFIPGAKTVMGMSVEIELSSPEVASAAVASEPDTGLNTLAVSMIAVACSVVVIGLGVILIRARNRRAVRRLETGASDGATGADDEPRRWIKRRLTGPRSSKTRRGKGGSENVPAPISQEEADRRRGNDGGAEDGSTESRIVEV